MPEDKNTATEWFNFKYENIFGHTSGCVDQTADCITTWALSVS